MRTLASTFSTTEEAEAARRHLESIGISRERIILKDVAPAAEAPGAGSGGAGSTRQAFISVKVTTDQVERASEILKGRWQTRHEAAPPDFESRPVRSAQDAGTGASVPPRPLPVRDAGLAQGLPRQGSEAPPLTGEARRTVHERARRSRYVIFFLLALVGAFMIGAWLGLAS
jgi:hypothetical protein